MKFATAYSEEPIKEAEPRLTHYYHYYIVAKEPRLPSLRESIATLQDESGGLEKTLGADGIVSGRVDQGKTAVDFIVRQIEDRERLKTRHITEINETVEYVTGKILMLDHFYLGKNRSVDQTRSSFHKQLQQLEQERRQEETAAWRDQTHLLKDFLDAWGEYRTGALTYSFFTPSKRE